ncbi:MAG: autotransporter outer membrane beta-barrel domain-containing protein [Sulfuritalea sp.]|nr:autotransporter outer membrane beta-barrel domain-containing protein [Sulfuritalea sp.]
MKKALLQLLIGPFLLFSSGLALASVSISVGVCNTDNIEEVSGGGFTGSGSCPITYSDGSNTASGTVNISASGFSVSVSGSLTGAFTFFAGSGSLTTTQDGYLFFCSVNNTGGVGSTSLSGSCTANAGGAGGTTSSSGAQQQAQATVVQQINAISNVINARMLANIGGPQPTKRASAESGLAAGNISEKWNGWAALNTNNSSYAPSNTNNKRSADVTNAVFGADYQITPTAVLGLSAAVDRGNGSVGAGSTGISTNGFAIGPYVGMQLGPNMALDLSAGLGRGEVRQTGGIKAKSDRRFAAANLGYVRWSGDLQYSGKLGYLVSTEKYGDISTNGTAAANTSSKSEIGQLNLGAEVAYWMNNGTMPYLGLAYSRDTRLNVTVNDPNWDRDSFTLKLGLNFFSLASKVTGGIAYTEEFGRRNARNATLMGNINFRF